LLALASASEALRQWRQLGMVQAASLPATYAVPWWRIELPLAAGFPQLGCIRIAPSPARSSMATAVPTLAHATCEVGSKPCLQAPSSVA
jgi:hypothetical protein